MEKKELLPAGIYNVTEPRAQCRNIDGLWLLEWDLNGNTSYALLREVNYYITGHAYKLTVNFPHVIRISEGTRLIFNQYDNEIMSLPTNGTRMVPFEAAAAYLRMIARSGQFQSQRTPFSEECRSKLFPHVTFPEINDFDPAKIEKLGSRAPSPVRPPSCEWGAEQNGTPRALTPKRPRAEFDREEEEEEETAAPAENFKMRAGECLLGVGADVLSVLFAHDVEIDGQTRRFCILQRENGVQVACYLSDEELRAFSVVATADDVRKHEK